MHFRLNRVAAIRRVRTQWARVITVIWGGGAAECPARNGHEMTGWGGEDTLEDSPNLRTNLTSNNLKAFKGPVNGRLPAELSDRLQATFYRLYTRLGFGKS